ncbi:MAG: hypothetical protein ACREB5_10045 [Sphingomonadaceae bacterium]
MADDAAIRSSPRRAGLSRGQSALFMADPLLPKQVATVAIVPGVATTRMTNLRRFAALMIEQGVRDVRDDCRLAHLTGRAAAAISATGGTASDADRSASGSTGRIAAGGGAGRRSARSAAGAAAE